MRNAGEQQPAQRIRYAMLNVIYFAGLRAGFELAAAALWLKQSPRPFDWPSCSLRSKYLMSAASPAHHAALRLIPPEPPVFWNVVRHLLATLSRAARCAESRLCTCYARIKFK